MFKLISSPPFGPCSVDKISSFLEEYVRPITFLCPIEITFADAVFLSIDKILPKWLFWSWAKSLYRNDPELNKILLFLNPAILPPESLALYSPYSLIIFTHWFGIKNTLKSRKFLFISAFKIDVLKQLGSFI